MVNFKVFSEVGSIISLDNERYVAQTSSARDYIGTVTMDETELDEVLRRLKELEEKGEPGDTRIPLKSLPDVPDPAKPPIIMVKNNDYIARAVHDCLSTIISSRGLSVILVGDEEQASQAIGVISGLEDLKQKDIEVDLFIYHQ